MYQKGRPATCNRSRGLCPVQGEIAKTDQLRRYQEATTRRSRCSKGVPNGGITMPGGCPGVMTEGCQGLVREPSGCPMGLPSGATGGLSGGEKGLSGV